MSATPKDQVLRPNLALQLSEIPFGPTPPLISCPFGRRLPDAAIGARGIRRASAESPADSLNRENFLAP